MGVTCDISIQDNMIVLRTLALNDRSLIERLEQLYAYEFSVMSQLALSPDGLFPPNETIAQIWSDPRRHTRLIFLGTEPAGFAIVREIDATQFEIEQFLVLRKFRRSGLGKLVAFKLFRAFRGHWKVRQVDENKAAQKFWRTVIGQYTGGKFSESKTNGIMQEFTS